MSDVKSDPEAKSAENRFSIQSFIKKSINLKWIIILLDKAPLNWKKVSFQVLCISYLLMILRMIP